MFVTDPSHAPRPATGLIFECVIGGRNADDYRKGRAELDKCVLLWMNCHNELHAGLIVLTEQDNQAEWRIPASAR